MYRSPPPLLDREMKQRDRKILLLVDLVMIPLECVIFYRIIPNPWAVDILIPLPSIAGLLWLGILIVFQYFRQEPLPKNWQIAGCSSFAMLFLAVLLLIGLPISAILDDLGIKATTGINGDKWRYIAIVWVLSVIIHSVMTLHFLHKPAQKNKR